MSDLLMASWTSHRMIIAIDPGYSTGWAVGAVKLEDESLDWLVAGQQEAAIVLADFITYITPAERPNVDLVIERFILAGGPNAVGKIPEFTLELIGRFLQTADIYHLSTKKQNPGDRNIISDDALKSMNYWIPGRVDAVSATKHLLGYLIREGTVPKSVLVVK